MNIDPFSLSSMPDLPADLCAVTIGRAEVGQAIASHPGIPLVSATVAKRLGRSLHELGGNNGLIVFPSADLDLVLRGVVFAAAGTCGQRCTTLRRLLVHVSLEDSLIERLRKAYESLPIGDPREAGVLVGPLIDKAAFENMQGTLVAAPEEGGRIFGGERITEGVPEKGYYVKPAIVEIRSDAPIVEKETFAPILFVLTYQNLEGAIALHNAVPQGLASAIFTESMKEAELFLSAAGSDCGIANVNIGTSGAEIGGEKKPGAVGNRAATHGKTICAA